MNFFFFIDKFSPGFLPGMGRKSITSQHRFIIVSHLQLFVLLLFNILRNFFPTLKLSYDGVHFSSIRSGTRNEFFDEKKKMHESSRKTHQYNRFFKLIQNIILFQVKGIAIHVRNCRRIEKNDQNHAKSTVCLGLPRFFPIYFYIDLKVLSNHIKTSLVVYKIKFL